MHKILVIEDNSVVRESIVDLLETQKYEVFTANDGADGIEMAETCKPSLVLCDVMMPKKNGHEVLRELRKKAHFADVPFIFLSAKSQISDLRQGMNLGADDYLTKPFKAKELFHAIDTRLRKKEKEAESIAAKIKSSEPLGNKIFSNNLLSSIQYQIDEAYHTYQYMEDYTSEDIREIIHNLAQQGEKIKRIAHKTVMYHQLELIEHSEEIKQYFTAGNTSIQEDLIKSVAIPIAEEYERPYDLYFKDIDAATISVPYIHMKNILMEVLDNAFKFSAKKTLVTIEGKVIGDEYHVTIEDNGAGIDSIQAQNLGKTPIITKNRFSLGLFLVKSILRPNGGSLIFTSAPGAGTKVKLKILI